jgi:hypothetical protein
VCHLCGGRVGVAVVDGSYRKLYAMPYHNLKVCVCMFELVTRVGNDVSVDDV